MRICIDTKTGLQVSCIICPLADRCPKNKENQKKVTKK